MHYYKRNIGDYAKKAGRLTMMQHGAYTLLLDACYDREVFPTLEQALEWTWAASDQEIEAVKFVLSRFFSLSQNGTYVQDRILEELLQYHKNADTNKRIAQERETKRKENSTVRVQVVNEPPPNHKPLTTNHKPITNNQDKNKDTHTDFDEIKKAYPKRGGGQRWQDAERAYNSRLQEGSTHQEILDGVYRYARYCDQTGKTNTEYVQQAATFFGRNQGYREPWTPPAMVKDVRQMSAPERVRMAMSQKDDRVINVQPENKLLDVFDLTKLVK